MTSSVSASLPAAEAQQECAVSLSSVIINCYKPFFKTIFLKLCDRVQPFCYASEHYARALNPRGCERPRGCRFLRVRAGRVTAVTAVRLSVDSQIVIQFVVKYILCQRLVYK